MGTLWFIRHGETLYGSGEPRFCGSSDMPLTPRGDAQATAIARRLAERPLTALYITPLQRTAQTAHPLAEMTGLTPVVCPDLRELDWGAWEGLTRAEAVARDPEFYARYQQEPLARTPPGGEPLSAFAERIETALTALAAQHANEEIAVFTHKCVIRVLLCRLLDLPIARYPAIKQGEGAVNRIICEPQRIIVAGVNDLCHLTHDDSPCGEEVR